EALEEALDAYEGTIVTISHDRYFLDRVATQILALDGAGGAEHYEGDYTEYHDWKQRGLRGETKSTEYVPENLVSVAPELTKSFESEAEASERKKPAQTKKGEAKKQAIKVVKKKRPESRAPELVENEIAHAEKLLNSVSEQMGMPEVARDASRLIK